MNVLDVFSTEVNHIFSMGNRNVRIKLRKCTLDGVWDLVIQSSFTDYQCCTYFSLSFLVAPPPIPLCYKGAFANLSEGLCPIKLLQSPATESHVCSAGIRHPDPKWQQRRPKDWDYESRYCGVVHIDRIAMLGRWLSLWLFPFCCAQWQLIQQCLVGGNTILIDTWQNWWIYLIN